MRRRCCCTAVPSSSCEHFTGGTVPDIATLTLPDFAQAVGEDCPEVSQCEEISGTVIELERYFGTICGKNGNSVCLWYAAISLEDICKNEIAVHGDVTAATIVASATQIQAELYIGACSFGIDFYYGFTDAGLSAPWDSATDYDLVNQSYFPGVCELNFATFGVVRFGT